MSLANELRKQRGPQRNIVDISPINEISPICFHFSRGSDDFPSKEHFENPKLSRMLELFFFCHIFELYLVTQSIL
jgi:hypothetical protein